MPPNLPLSVVVPSYNESTLIPTLESLKKTSSRTSPIKVYLVFNASETDVEQVRLVNHHAYNEVLSYKTENESNFFQLVPIIEEHLDPKKAGVGLARKIGMDLAAMAYREKSQDGIIACLDADCIVSENYTEALKSYFELNPGIKACSIYFEHLFDDGDAGLREGIIQYEIHLRYYKQALNYCGFPWPYHTVGSSMAVRSSVYLNSGGMNTRKAGEDFYFLQKLFSQYPFGECNETVVYPLGRLSRRVPFGTGAAMHKWDEAGRREMPTYALASFLAIREVMIQLEAQVDGASFGRVINEAFPDSEVARFLKQEGIHSLIGSEQFLRANPVQLKTMFYRWFNNFRILKCLNYLRDVGYSSGSILKNASELLELLDLEAPTSSEEVLYLYRKLDKLATNRKAESN